jgi:hypothetical protein
VKDSLEKDSSLESDEQPVTGLVVHQVQLGKEKIFEQVLTELINSAKTVPGSLSVTVMRPEEGKSDYKVLFTFNSETNLAAWRSCETHRQIIQKMYDVSAEPPTRFTLSGLETWFSLPSPRVMTPPPRWKMVLVTWAVIWPLLCVTIPLEWMVIGPLPLFVKLAITPAITISLLTYIIMPSVVWLLSGWLYKEIPKIQWLPGNQQNMPDGKES